MVALRGPEEAERKSRTTRPTELDTKLPADPFNAGLKKGMFDFAPTSIADLRKTLESMQGAYPKALVSRLDTSAEQHDLHWTGSVYEEKKDKQK